MPILIQITEPWDAKDVEAAQRTLARLADGQAPTEAALGSVAAHQQAGQAAGALLYQRAGAGGLTRQLLELLPSSLEEAETPAEIGQRMRPKREKAEVRAAIRNVRRIEGTLQKEGATARGVLLADSGAYEKDGASRYYIAALDRAAIDALAKPRSGR